VAKKEKTDKTLDKEESVADSFKRIKDPEVTKYYSTGSTLLDLAISNKYPGGVAADGRITHIYGANSTAKTVLVQEILGACQRSNGYAVFADAEGTLDYDRANLFGLQVSQWGDEFYRLEVKEKEEVAYNAKKKKDEAVQEFVSSALKENDNFICVQPPSIEHMFDNILDTICYEVEEGNIIKNVVVGVDSLSSLPSEAELDNKLSEATYGTTRAKQLSTGFRKYIRDLTQNKVSVIFIDQTRDSIGMGKNNKVSGGNALKFYASTRIWLNNPKEIKNKHEQTIGVEITFLVEKNKIAPPFRSGKLCILFDLGIDDVRANINWLLEIKDIPCKITKKTSWFQWDGESIGQGIDPAIKYIEDNNLEKELEEEVFRVWKLLYETPERKKRYE